MYADVVVPLAISGTLTYLLPDDMTIEPQRGMRVLVPIGKRKIYTGIILRLTDVAPTSFVNIKSVICLLDDRPIVTEHQLQLWQWIANYYMCSLGEVCKAALPTVLKLESEMRISINDDFIADHQLPATEQRILDLLSDGKPHEIDDLAKQMDMKTVARHINELIMAGAIIADEYVAEKYKAKYEYYVALHSDIRSAEELQTVLDSLRRAAKQQQLLNEYLSLSHYDATGDAAEIKRDALLSAADSSAAILKQLVDKHILQIVKKQIDRLQDNASVTRSQIELNTFQQEALDTIYDCWQTKNVVLLHGVTSSGKTEIYIKLIQEAIANNRQVLYLVPEIALTTQLTDRLRAVFGSQLGVYHSKYSDSERAETYYNLLADKSYKVVIGVRSSIFLPFHRLGLIIVDEEHDGSYKQQDPAPRYNARNTAIVMGHLHGAKVLLGTATPSVESYYNAQIGKYGLAEIKHRYNDVSMPSIQIVDLADAYKRKEIEGYFSDAMLAQMRKALNANEQVIVFQNRRGFAPYVSCKSCGYVPKCVNCDVSLTVHKRFRMLSCHYCGYTISLPDSCPVCHQQTLIDHGFGTERLEDQLRELFPNSSVARMDLDTTRSRSSYEKIINDFASHKIDILVGTQMVTKGLHFNDVSVVSVMNADNLLNQPDFRAYERAFQMLEQVSGRAGRTEKQGVVIIQTRQPDDGLLQQVKHHDFIGFYNQQLLERKTFRYPPFYRLLQITLKHRDENTLRYASEQLQRRLTAVLGNRTSTVIVPVVAWVQNLHIRHIMIRVENQSSIVKVKELITQNIKETLTLQAAKNTIIYVDVDPV